MDELSRRGIVLNDKNPRGFACPWHGYRRLSGLIRNDRNEGKYKIEAGSLAELAFDPQFAAMQLDEARSDGQSQACALGGATRFCQAEERFEDTLLLFRWNSWATVAALA